MPEVHWPRGGSNSDQIYHCPGSVNMRAAYPDEDVSGPAAIDGTHTHTGLEYCLKDNLVDAHLIEGKELEDHEGKFIMDPDRCKRINQALNYIYKKVRFGGLDYWSEAFVDTGAQFGIPEWGGSIDVTLFGGEWKVLELADYKDGGRPVGASTMQLVTYGGGVIDEFRKRGMAMPETVMCTIIQPKVYPAPFSKVYTFSEFMVKLNNLAEKMKLSLDPNAPREAGDHCKYCPGAKLARCPEYSNKAQEAMNIMLQNPNQLPPPVEGALEPAQALPLQLPEIGAETTDETLAAILDAESIILGIIKEAKKEGTRRAVEENRVLPNYVLSRATTQRRWAKGAADELNKMRIKDKQEVLYAKKLKSPAALLESDAFKKMSETQKEKVKALVEKPEGAPVLKPATGEPVPLIDKEAQKKQIADVPAAPAAADDSTIDFM